MSSKKLTLPENKIQVPHTFEVYNKKGPLEAFDEMSYNCGRILHTFSFYSCTWTTGAFKLMCVTWTTCKHNMGDYLHQIYYLKCVEEKSINPQQDIHIVPDQCNYFWVVHTDIYYNRNSWADIGACSFEGNYTLLVRALAARASS